MTRDLSQYGHVIDIMNLYSFDMQRVNFRTSVRRDLLPITYRRLVSFLSAYENLKISRKLCANEEILEIFPFISVTRDFFISKICA